MLSVSCVGLFSAFCALLMTWMSACQCAAQSDPLATARSEMANFSVPLDGGFAPGPRLEHVNNKSRRRPWLIAAATTTAALAAGFLVLEGFSYKNSAQASKSSDRSRDFTLDVDTRLRNQQQFGAAQDRANLMSKISDICLAGTVAATGVTLLLWLTGKRRREEQPIRTLLGPMVLKGGGGAGGGLVLRNKF